MTDSEEGRGNRQKRAAGRAHSPHRLEALTDGVFAIAMTILVLELRVPGAGPDVDVIKELQHQWPIFAAYVVSFVLLGVYWYGQRSQYDFIRHVDRGLTWLNIFFLLGVATVPFAAALLGEHYDLENAIHFYGAVLLFCSCMHAAIWWYATNAKRDLVDAEATTSEVITVGKRLSTVPVIFYVIAMVVSYIDPRLSLLLFAIVPFLYVFDAVRNLRLPGSAAVEPGEDVPE